MNKTYSRARAAIAAARAFCDKAGILAAEIIREETSTGFTCVIVASEAHVSMITAAGWMFRAAPSVTSLPEGLLDLPTVENKEEITFEPGPADVPYPAPAQEEVPVAPAPKASGYIAERSSLEKPTKKVWHIADAMKGKPRKDVIAECRRQGIAFGTARTQYQEWKKANGH